MAVTLTIAELRSALRLNDSTEETAEVTRLLAYATEAVAKHAPNATDVAHNEAARRIAGYLFDQPEAGRGMSFANALRSSGAARMLLPYRIHRAGYADAVADAQAAVGTTDNPVIDVDYSGTTLTVTYLDATTEDFTIAGGGVDQMARDAATAAQTTADDAETAAATASTAAGTAQTAAAVAQTTADTAETAAGTAQTTAAAAQVDIDDHEANHPTGGGGGTGVLDVESGRLPAAPVQARLAWKDASESVTASSFGVGSADGMTDLILIPDYPQAFLDAGVTTATLIFWAATDSDPASFAPFDSDEVDFTGTALTVDGVAGQYWLTVDLRTQYISETPITILFPGVLIATQPWVTEQIGAATPTPPVVLVDGASYTAHGEITATGWRGYNFVQFLYANAGSTYQTEPVNTGRLLAQAPIIVSVGRNVHWALSFSATDDDVLTIATSTGNSVPAPSATSTMTVIGW